MKHKARMRKFVASENAVWIHPDKYTYVSKAADFARVNEGGCSQSCSALLSCGHICTRLCHIQDRKHENYKCFEKCNKILCDLGHMCQKFCSETCGECCYMVSKLLSCGHEQMAQCYLDINHVVCKVIITKQLPACEHNVDMYCGADPLKFPCTYPCEDRLPCGHSCDKRCHAISDPDHLEYKCYKKCPRMNKGCSRNHECMKLCHEECEMCSVLLELQTLECGHTHRVQCSEDLTKFQCNRSCLKTLPCKHKCPMKCYEDCGNCSVLVQKVIESCGHQILLDCSETPDSSKCKKKCKKRLSCGHTCTGLCSDDCSKINCSELVDSEVKAECGHIVKMPCHMKGKDLDNFDLFKTCYVKCETILACGHLCPGSCKTCFQGRYHVQCQEKCGRILICGHSCDVPCASNCPPCKKKCTYRCPHSHCNKNCGQPCVQCQEQCVWKCEHLRCSRRCYQQCNRPPCYNPCKKLLKCGHPCIGFCGEPCPKLCRVCDEELVTSVFLGFEDDPDARFVYLVDCGHSIESQGLEKWLQDSDSEIKMKVCPLCKTPITRTQRFMNYTKKLYQDILTVKRKVFGEKSNIEKESRKLLSKLSGLAFPAGTYYRNITSEIIDMLTPIANTVSWRDGQCGFMKHNRLIQLSRLDIETISIYVQFLNEMYVIMKKILCIPTLKLTQNKIDKTELPVMKYFEALSKMIGPYKNNMSQQEVIDLNLETKRIYRIAQFWNFMNSVGFNNSIQKFHGKSQFEVLKMLPSIHRYSDEIDKRVSDIYNEFGTVIKLNTKIILEERKEIVKAMGLKQGHWFKCPKGHIYVITECGGAMQVGKCNECGAEIGGTNHTLLISNQIASEMDGAQHAAWSDAANLENYVFDDLM